MNWTVLESRFLQCLRANRFGNPSLSMIHESTKESPPDYLPNDYSLSRLDILHHTEVSLLCEAQLNRDRETIKVQVNLYSSSFHFRFGQEATAYKKMVSSGIEDNIPRVYGFMYWESSKWNKKFPHVLVYEFDVYAIITESLGSSYVNMGSENIGPTRAACAVMSLENIHRAGILHGNVVGNLLVNPSINRTVWVGFENCRLADDHTPEESEAEMLYVTTLLYGQYVGILNCNS